MTGLPDLVVRIREATTGDLVEVAQVAPIGIIRQYFVEREPDYADQVDEIEVEWRRWMALCAVHAPKRWPMCSKGVDAFWHRSVLCTADYAAYCQKLGRFIHHRPWVGGMPSNAAEETLAFRQAYRELFGEEAPTHLWSDTFDSECDGGGCGC